MVLSIAPLMLGMESKEYFGGVFSLSLGEGWGEGWPFGFLGLRTGILLFLSGFGGNDNFSNW